MYYNCHWTVGPDNNVYYLSDRSVRVQQSTTVAVEFSEVSMGFFFIDAMTQWREVIVWIAIVSLHDIVACKSFDPKLDRSNYVDI